MRISYYHSSILSMLILVCLMVPAAAGEYASESVSTIVAAEYFIDTDPGEGQGISLSANDGSFNSPIEDVNISLDTSNLRIGIHNLFVRMKNAEGAWGTPRKVMFDVAGDKRISGMEYYIDTDLGVGNGLPLKPSDGSFGHVMQFAQGTIDTSNSPLGLHTLYVRARDSEDHWGTSRQFKFEIIQSSDIPVPPIITGAEYYIDTDLGEGNGTALNPVDSKFDSSLEAVHGLLVTSALSVDIHTLYVRAKDSYSRWGGSEYVTFSVGQSVPLDRLDHFEFLAISSPQIVNVPFNVTITAKDKNGNPLYDLDIWICLSSAGRVSPTSVHMINGTWTGAVTLSEGGNAIKLIASGYGVSGESNPFNTTGQIAEEGILGGTVTDNSWHPLQNAVVYLAVNESEPPVYSSNPTDGEGRYYLENIASGNYYIWAEYNGYRSVKTPIFVPGGRCIVQDLIVNIYKNTEKIPVVLVAGIMGSTNKNANPEFIYPWLKGPDYEKPKDLKLLDPTIAHVRWWSPGWKELKKLLNERGLNDNTDIIDCPWDWRVPLDKAVTMYLKPAIEKAQGGDPNKKVNILAHSMGGLIVRAYIQGKSSITPYNNEIENFTMVGTPNMGSSNAYYIWEGGDPLKVDNLLDSISSGFINFYWKVTERLFEETYKLGDLSPYSTPIIKKFINDKVLTVQQLLPTYDFLKFEGTTDAKPITTSGNVNTFLLEDLNGSSNRYELMGRPDSTGKVKTRLYWSGGEDTIKEIDVKPFYDVWCFNDSPRWEDGRPYKDPDFEGRKGGDGTVPSNSAKLPCDEEWEWAECKEVTGEHSNLIRENATAIVNDLYPVPSSWLPPYRVESSTVTASLHFTFNGRVQPYLVDPQGRSIGINYMTGAIENTIPDASVSIDAEIGSLSINNPLDGTYILYGKGIYNEDYSFSLGYLDEEKAVEIKHRAFNHANTTSFTFTVNRASSERIAINLTPPPPTALQANPVTSDGLKTSLSWDASTDIDVTGYNIYSREVYEPYLTQIGTVSINSFNTGHPWAENSSIKTRLYSISAVKNDGSESFLSEMVGNNDRDHDGLTDEDETFIGTDMTNPDTDGDGLTDGDETIQGTNPLLGDTDGDGYSDYQEVQAGSDPLDPNSIPLHITSITQSWSSDNDITITWESTAGLSYDVYLKNTFSGSFTKVATVNASGTSTSWTDDGTWQGGTHPTTVQQRYYKVSQNGTDSENTVGMYKIIASQGMNLISLPLIPFSTALKDVIGSQVTGAGNEGAADRIWVWNGTNYEFAWLVEGTGNPAYDGKWYTGNSETTITLGADQGAWLQIRPGHGNQTVYLLGEVSSTDREIPLSVGMNLIGTCYPVSIPLGDQGANDSNLWESGATGAMNEGGADRVWSWTGSNYQFHWLVDGAGPTYDGLWYTGNQQSTLQLEPGKGYWVQIRPGHDGFHWVYPKPYTEP